MNRFCCLLAIVYTTKQTDHLATQAHRSECPAGSSNCGRDLLTQNGFIPGRGQPQIVDQLKDLAARRRYPVRSIQAEPHKVALVVGCSLAFKTFHQLGDQFVVAGERQLDEIMKSERRVAERGIDTPIGNVLLKEVLKKPTRGLCRRAIARPERKINWDRITATEKQLI